MIDKTKAQTSGYQIVRSSAQQDEERVSKIEELKKMIPAFVNSDGAVNINAIVDFIGSKNATSNDKGYELTFAGKSLARHLSDTETRKELKIELEQSKNFNETGNIIIRGDNLDALKILRQSYYGKVKMIYIDPPYNTRNDGFVYVDNFKQSTEGLIEHLNLEEKTLDYIDNMYGTKTHSGWLAFMYPRLKLARDLLIDDGVIFISIDDNEQANLKIMCDEIFGESNFVTTIKWQKKTGASDASTIATVTEYILVYTKTSNVDSSFRRDESSYDIRRYQLTDEHEKERGNYYIDNLDRGGLQYSDSLNFSIKCPDGSTTYPNGRTEKINDGWTWKWSKKKVEWAIKNDFLEFRRSQRKKSGWSVCYKNYLNVDNMGKQITRAAPQKNIIRLDDSIDDVLNANARNDMNALFSQKVFSNPKPCDLLKKIILYLSFTDGIILDFFAGSGTTAHAVMDLNKQDNGKRKFILIQWDEEIKQENSKPAYDFCKKNKLKPVISSICIERVHRAGEKIKQETDMLNQDLDIGYKVFSLIEKPRLEEVENQPQLSHQRQTTRDTLYNMIAASGQNILTDSIETIEPDLLYRINDAYYVLGECKTDLKTIGKVFIDGYANISLEKWLNMLGLNKENITILY